MPKYYTSTFLYCDDGKVGNNPYEYLPALLFFDTDGDLALEEAHAAARAALEFEEPLLVCSWELPRLHHRAWFFSTELHIPGPSSARPGNWYRGIEQYPQFAPQLIASDGTLTDLEPQKHYASCEHAVQNAEGCPCPRATTKCGEHYRALTTCLTETVYLKRDLVPLARLQRRDTDRYKDLPKHAGGFRFVEERTIEGKISYRDDGYGAPLLRASFTAEYIEEALEELSARALTAAATRKFRREECASCAFTCTSASRNCEGAVSPPQAEMYLSKLLTRDTKYRRIQGFTELQQAFLLGKGGDQYVTSSVSLYNRPRRYKLGFFTRHGTYRIVRAAKRGAARGDYEDVSSWEELVTYIPALQEQYETSTREHCWVAPLPLWAQRAVAAVSLRPYRERRVMFGTCQDNVTSVRHTRTCVSVYFNHNGWATYSWTPETSATEILEAVLGNVGPSLYRTLGKL